MHNFKDILFIGLLILSSTYEVEYNIALNKVVTTSNNVPDHMATMVIDQDLNTYVQVNPESFNGIWILFDLKGIYNILKIIIWPTNDYDFVLARVNVNIRLNNNTAYDPTDLFCTYDVPAKGVAFDCSKPDKKLGRFVVLNKMYLTESIKISEVAILASDTDLLVPITGQVEQSHVLRNLPNYIATKAIDGDLYTCIHTAQEIVENRNIPGWWRTDLGETYQISAVNINDYNAPDQNYRGYYSVYVDSGGFTKLQLCSFFNQSSEQFNSFFKLKCSAVSTGRYLTVERISNKLRVDALNFCEIQVVALVKDSAYILPTNYIGASSTSTTTTTTTTSTTTTTTTTTTTSNTPVLSSPTSPLTTSSTTKTPFTSTTTISTSATRLIKKKQEKVFQNHDYRDSPSDAKYAVDYNPQTCSNTAQEDANNRNIGGWWRADLEDIYVVVYLYICDRYGQQGYPGYFSIFIDRENNTQSQLCRNYDQPTSATEEYTYLTCNGKVTGRFLTISKIPGRERIDALSLCEVQVYGYLHLQTNITTTTTTTTTIPTETCSDSYTDCQQKVQHQYQVQLEEMKKVNNSCQTDKIVIGVVVFVLTAILFVILGFLSGYVYHKKRNVRPTEATIYESTKENKEEHVYSDLNNTPMQEIYLYNNENK